jgi:phage shock protein A
MIERRLREVADELKRVRAELAVSTEQLTHFENEADEARIRSMVSETPLSEQSYQEAARHAETMRRHHVDLQDRLVALEQRQDELLDQMMS